MEGALAVGCLGTFFVVLIGGLIWWGMKQTQQRQAVWRDVASKRGGRYLEPRWGLFQSRSEGIEVRVGHAIVLLDLYVVSTGKSSTTYTRARARFALGAGPVFKVYEEGIFSSIGKALGTQDLELGDARFDEIYMVKGEGVDALRRAWTDDARATLMSSQLQIRAESDGREVKLIVLGGLSEPAALNAMLDLCGELASFGARSLDGLASIEGARLEPASGSWESPAPPRLSIATERGEVTASIGPGARGPRLRLTLGADRDLPPFSADVAAGRADGMPKGVLTERAAPMLRRLEGATISGDGRQLRAAWSGVPDRETVKAGAELLAELAGGTRSVGAFR